MSDPAEDQDELLGAWLSPLVAYLIDRDMGVMLRRRVVQLQASGNSKVAHQLNAAVGQIRTAGRQYAERHALTSTGGTSGAGSAEVPTLTEAAAWSTKDVSTWFGTRAVAERLGVGERQVVNLINSHNSSRLSAIRVRGRWLVSPESLLEELERRRSSESE